VRFIFRPQSVKRPQRRIIRIYSNGESEYNYFISQKQLLVRQFAIDGRRNIKIDSFQRNADIKAMIQVIKKLNPVRDLLPGDRIYCVLDVDDLRNNKINEALAIKPPYINLILSNPNFELWLLLHFRFHNQRITKDETVVKLREYLPHYSKPNIEPIFPTLKEKEPDAIRNSKTLREQRKQEQIDLFSIESNPHTHLDFLIEFLNSLIIDDT